MARMQFVLNVLGSDLGARELPRVPCKGEWVVFQEGEVREHYEVSGIVWRPDVRGEEVRVIVVVNHVPGRPAPLGDEA